MDLPRSYLSILSHLMLYTLYARIRSSYLPTNIREWLMILLLVMDHSRMLMRIAESYIAHDTCFRLIISSIYSFPLSMSSPEWLMVTILSFIPSCVGVNWLRTTEDYFTLPISSPEYMLLHLVRSRTLLKMMLCLHMLLLLPSLLYTFLLMLFPMMQLLDLKPYCIKTIALMYDLGMIPLLDRL